MERTDYVKIKATIERKYNYVQGFKEGLAVVESNRKYGFINKTGKEVIPCKYEYARDFKEGLAQVKLDGKWRLVDKTGREVIPCKYDEACNFSENVAVVKLNGKYEIIDANGNVTRLIQTKDLYVESGSTYNKEILSAELIGFYSCFISANEYVVVYDDDYQSYLEKRNAVEKELEQDVMADIVDTCMKRKNLSL